MKEVTIYKHPVAEPGVCSRCLSQDRDWFVDLGLYLEGEKTVEGVDIPIWYDGAAYYCCVCINNLFEDVQRKFEEFKKNHETEVEFNGLRTDDIAVNVGSGIPGSYNRGSERSDPEAEHKRLTLQLK